MPINALPQDLPALLRVARGAQPADLLLRNGRIVNVFSGQIEEGDIAIFGDRIAGIGKGYAAREVVDLRGAHVAPGLIDAHVHIESSLCVPPQFARAVVPHGITTVIADPHEIANVAGIDGVRFMSESARALPLRVILMASSCVPATEMATSGAKLDAADLAKLRDEGTVYGLAEVMNFPGVMNGDEAVLSKLRAFADRPKDGHAPGVTGAQLNAYVASGIGSDHECVSLEEAAEKIARGMYILVREATNAHNLHPLLPLITPVNSRRICLCTDDRQPADLLAQGSIDYMVREAIRFGIEPVEAFRMATLNPCEWFGLHDRGAIAPGRLADMVIFDEITNLTVRQVIVGCRFVARDGRFVDSVNSVAAPPSVAGRSRIDFSRIDLRIRASGRRIRVIGLLENQLITDHRILDARIDAQNMAIADIERDILKMAVIERHHGTGNVGRGFIQGIGLKRGAIAGTVAHDHHNLVVIGCDDNSMLTAARGTNGAGLAVAEGQTVRATLPLPVAGLMSEQPIEQVHAEYHKLIAAARSLGSTLHDPFMAMSFMALEVIPKLKLTDKGLVDVDKFGFVDLFV